MTDTAPLTMAYRTVAPAVGTAGNDATTVLFQAPFAATVTAVQYIPAATITGAATNNRTVAVTNKAGTGSGSTTVASLNYGNGTNTTGFVPGAVTLSVTPADLVLASGDVLVWTSTHVSSGITDPGGMVVISISRN